MLAMKVVVAAAAVAVTESEESSTEANVALLLRDDAITNGVYGVVGAVVEMTWHVSESGAMSLARPSQPLLIICAPGAL